MKPFLRPLFFLPLLLAPNAGRSQNDEVRFSIIETTDVHGNYFPYDFINHRPGPGSMSRVATYIKRLRSEMGNHRVLYVDNGDILQGQPTAYYYNYVDTQSPHLAAAVVNYLEAVCSTPGNHDIETGHSVYDRWMNDCGFSVLGANVRDVAAKKGYFTAYTMEEVDGVQVGFLGLITPAIPQQIPPAAWSGLEFRDQLENARRVVPIMRRAGKADIVVVLMHSGVGEEGAGGTMLEHAAYQIAEQVPDIDIIFCGHDHRLANRWITNKVSGKKTLVLNAGYNAEHVAQANISVRRNARKRVVEKSLSGALVSVNDEQPDPDFMARFQKEFEAVKAYTAKVIGRNEAPMSTRPAFFGPSAFVDFIHQVQLKVSGADISFAAPLSFDAEIPEGPITMGDMFNLYKYENSLYVIKMTGAEIKNYLEESYAGWTAQMHSPTDHMLLFRNDAADKKENWQRLQTSSYNFDSAAGIRYTVDLRKPKGRKVVISSMADGKPFLPTRTYRVAINSYRALGGGHLLARGTGITADSLPARVVWTSPKEIRHYMIEEISRHDKIAPEPLFLWRFIPDGWAANAGERDATFLFQGRKE